MLAWIADLLTFSRVIISIWLIWLGVTQGTRALPQAVIITLLAWVGDSLDGWLARHARRPTRLGKYDFPIDVLLTWSTLTYVTLCGFLPMWLTALYTLLAGITVAALQRKAIMVLFMRPIDLTCGMVVLTEVPGVRWVVAVTLAGLAVAQRRRLRDRIPRWVREMKETLSSLQQRGTRDAENGTTPTKF
ncbi:MAG: CDP-alcohol phosphatidyltransferase family protein [Anaerolineae bacterium]|nr:CDP-alcohol phosphatidyltransferase family protein [Anaerolineae bacterium]